MNIILLGKPLKEWGEHTIDDYFSADVVRHNVTNNIDVYKRYEKDKRYEDLANMVARSVSDSVTTSAIIAGINLFLEYDVFTQETWDKLVPYLEKYLQFNIDYVELISKMRPLLKEIYDKYGNLSRVDDRMHLEFWQGAFSFGGHWANPEGKPNYT